MDPDELHHQKHAKYFLRFLKLLPPRLQKHDCSRMTITFYSVCGLDVLNRLDLLDNNLRKEIINWIYRCQVVPKPGLNCGGFEGSTTFLLTGGNSKKKYINGGGGDCNTHNNSILSDIKSYNWGHLAMTYTAIATLITLGDDLKRLDRYSIIKGVEAVQKDDGSFSASIEGSESDMRFVYCAAAICSMLDDWGNINKLKMAEYIMNSIRYDYGVSQDGEMESHGGTTFCAIAALYLSNQLHLLSDNIIDGMKRWLIFRQTDGFHGRPNKLTDTCYSFWIGASLKILNALELTDYEQNRSYILSTQDNIVGGFSKWPGSSTDPFHTYFGLCGLSFIDENGLEEIMPSLNISLRAYNYLQNLQREWKYAKK